ncbi:hypothetical protein QVD17_38206 [Tagetes erecta]|uniref:Uncharacterized protein n=1 Tax=Tagetes erecta TaxID=13708 RepID=A0AAD8NJ80_TARER|nr:hypothetical protein QVD17_38206 [Tagetes erecta]
MARNCDWCFRSSVNEDGDDSDDGNDEEIEEHVSADNEDVIIEKVDVVGIAQEVVITEAESEAQSDDEADAHN